jgi:nitrite reductase/ring-hydroxylating ferredoxin subunit
VPDKISLCRVDEIVEGSAKRFEIDKKSIFIIHKGGDYFAYQNKCPHLQIELEWIPDQFLDADSGLIHCANHGALFLINTGECIAGPCLGEKLTEIEFTIENNVLEIAADLELT